MTINIYYSANYTRTASIHQILKDLQVTLDTEDAIIVISAKHLCVSSRGIKDQNSFTSTVEYGGVFEDVKYRNDFFKSLTFKLEK